MATMEERTVRIEEKVDRILAEVTRINGRVGKLESWKIEAERDAAYRKGKQEALITKRSIVILITASASLAAIFDVILRTF